jgi:hypothetical protein
MLKTVQLLQSLLLILITTVAQSIQFLRLYLPSRAALSAEVLFLRKQLTFYQERQISPRRLTGDAHFSLELWVSILPLERRVDDCQTRDPHRLASQGI